MRYFMVVVIVLGMSSFSYGGECFNGLCKKPAKVKSEDSRTVVVKSPWVFRPFGIVRKSK